MAADSMARGGLLERAWAFWAMVLVATVVGAVLRLYGLEKPSFWVDEFFTIARSGRHYLPWTHAVGYLPTQFSLWLHGADLGRIALDNITDWPALGVSERAARLGACWVGIATVPILGLLTRSVAGGGVAGVSALLVAITPWHLYWSQMARFYTTKFLFTSLFVLLFARGMQTGHRGYFAIASAAALLAYLSHTTAIFVVGACIAGLGLAWIARVPLPHLRAGVSTLALIAGVCGLLLVVKESAPLGKFASQSWDPSLQTLILGTVLRIEPVTCAVGLGCRGARVVDRDRAEAGSLRDPRERDRRARAARGPHAQTVLPRGSPLLLPMFLRLGATRFDVGCRDRSPLGCECGPPRRSHRARRSAHRGCIQHLSLLPGRRGRASALAAGL